MAYVYLTGSRHPTGSPKPTLVPVARLAHIRRQPRIHGRVNPPIHPPNRRLSSVFRPHALRFRQRQRRRGARDERTREHQRERPRLRRPRRPRSRRERARRRMPPHRPTTARRRYQRIPRLHRRSKRRRADLNLPTDAPPRQVWMRPLRHAHERLANLPHARRRSDTERRPVSRVGVVPRRRHRSTDRRRRRRRLASARDGRTNERIGRATHTSSIQRTTPVEVCPLIGGINTHT